MAADPTITTEVPRSFSTFNRLINEICLFGKIEDYKYANIVKWKAIGCKNDCLGAACVALPDIPSIQAYQDKDRKIGTICSYCGETVTYVTEVERNPLTELVETGVDVNAVIYLADDEYGWMDGTESTNYCVMGHQMYCDSTAGMFTTLFQELLSNSNYVMLRQLIELDTGFRINELMMDARASWGYETTFSYPLTIAFRRLHNSSTDFFKHMEIIICLLDNGAEIKDDTLHQMCMLKMLPRCFVVKREKFSHWSKEHIDAYYDLLQIVARKTGDLTKRVKWNKDNEYQFCDDDDEEGQTALDIAISHKNERAIAIIQDI